LSSRISYIDYQKEKIPPGNFLSPLVHKRLSFKHEDEFRLLLSHSARELGDVINSMPTFEEFGSYMPQGILVSADLDELISVVHVSPFAPEWFFESVRDLSKKLGFTFEVKKSSLNPDVWSPVF